MDYKIIKANGYTDLEINVNEAIKRGYRPIGGIHSAISGGGTQGYETTFFQAVIK